MKRSEILDTIKNIISSILGKLPSDIQNDAEFVGGLELDLLEPVELCRQAKITFDVVIEYGDTQTTPDELAVLITTKKGWGDNA